MNEEIYINISPWDELKTGTLKIQHKENEDNKFAKTKVGTFLRGSWLNFWDLFCFTN